MGKVGRKKKKYKWVECGYLPTGAWARTAGAESGCLPAGVWAGTAGAEYGLLSGTWCGLLNWTAGAECGSSTWTN